jgi:hypothetical protein
MNTETPPPESEVGFVCANVVDLLRSQNGKKEKSNTRGSYEKKTG